ncbi:MULTISPECIES: MBL fold metallo-hydrolase [unclassified Streptomyces]|uniref:MBL fold metallo-hydrolase n=1 Tax=unclassified Streptomyces TaxID=2593676 RepID=UPI0022554E3F|nr:MULTISPECIES: MBL fold metallo-hydrolase [unclassified Streptomyces]MCX5334169.1 MBL fold metallo-hydrolase [Streptomyces sp. NBC_00140]MCX5363671.1 MBL fold metallo-hydrolase [Streptomyces sp. NBC_00124]
MTVTWEELGWERVAAGVGRCRLPGWDCTAGLVVGSGTALLIDAGSSLGEGARLRAQAESLAGHRVTHLALTHPHFDHVFGAAAFAGAEVYGPVGMDALFDQHQAREALRADAIRNGLDTALADEAVDALPHPHHHVSGEWTLDLGGGRQVLLANVGPGHTGHDLVVLVPGSPEVVFCGDLVEESGEPQAGPDAVPSHWPAALDRLLDLGGEDALYVPGHGAVVDAAFVRRQRDALATRFGVSR